MKIVRVVLLLTVFAVLTMGAESCGETTVSQEAGTETSETSSSSSGGKKKAKKAKPEMTSGQENALEAARSYLDMGGMSKKGLIQQLSSSAGDGFTRAEARFAAKHVGADWKKEAVEAAQSYLDMGGMSRQGLYEQLSSAAGEEFTPAQARYAVDKVYD